MQKTKRATGIRAKIKFYNWAVKTGIDLKNFEPERLDFELAKQKSTFKNRAAEIKDRFNHVFKTQNPIEGYPNIENLIFEPKN